jgi:hypothetical protein
VTTHQNESALRLSGTHDQRLFVAPSDSSPELRPGKDVWITGDGLGSHQGRLENFRQGSVSFQNEESTVFADSARHLGKKGWQGALAIGPASTQKPVDLGTADIDRC